MFWSYIRKHIKTILKIRDDDDVKFIEDKSGSVRPTRFAVDWDKPLTYIDIRNLDKKQKVHVAKWGLGTGFVNIGWVNGRDTL